MKAVSEAYRASMKGVLRNPSRVRITFVNIDTTAADDGSWAAESHAPWSEVETLDGFYAADKSAPYATLELNRWVLGRQYSVVPDSGDYLKHGFCSGQTSDTDGFFTEIPELCRNFANDHTLPALTITFDSRCSEWPRKFTVLYYLDGSVVAEHTVEDAISPTVVVPLAAEAVDSIRIRFDQMLPGRRCRVERVVFGEIIVFEDKKVVSVQQKHDVDPLSRRLPSKTLSVTVTDYEMDYDPDNPQGVWAYIDAHAPLSVQYGYELDDGTMEWLAADRYTLNGRPKAKNYQATFTGVGLISYLGGTYYKGTFGEKSFYDMAESVLLDAGLQLTDDGKNPWAIDESLKTKYCTSPLPVDSHMNCLQLIAHACCCRLYTDSENIIRIEPFTVRKSTLEPSAVSDFFLDFSTITEKTQALTKTEQLKSISVSLSRLVSDGETTTIFEGTTDKTVYHVDFPGPATNVEVSVTGGELLSAQIYAYAADLVFSEGTKEIKITGVQHSTAKDTVTLQVNAQGETDEENNPLITNEEMRDALAQHFIDWLGLRNTYDATYRGNPEVEAGDLVHTKTNYTEDIPALVLVHEIKYTGTLSGTMKVKAIL